MRAAWVVAALAGLSFFIAASAASAKEPVILSTDVGNEIDDQWAIAYLLTDAEDFEVLGIVSAQAPTLPSPSAHYSYRVLVDEVENHLNMVEHPPLLEGSSFPLKDTKTPQRGEGADFIVNASKGFSNRRRLTVLTIGAATDVASAILEDRSITERIRVVAMGFKSWSEGGDEFNIENDPKAWQVILSSDVPVTVGCADVCRANLSLTLEQARQLISQHGPVGAWLWAEFQAWYYRFVKPLRQDDFSKPWVIWDIITLAYLQGWTTQQVYPRPVLGDNLEFKPGPPGQTITWITSLDSKRLWADFLEKLDAYERSHAVRERGQGR